jgi:inner membrane protein
MLPIWAALLAAVFVWLTGRRAALAEAALVAGLALASHIVSDLITAYGTRVLAPLSDRRVALDLVFVIDPLFTAIIVLALVLSHRAGARRVAIALIGLAVLVTYMGGLAWLQRQVLDLGRDMAQAQAWDAVRVVALPQPFSPFHWAVIVVEEDRYHRSWVNLAGHPPLVPGLSALSWARTLAGSYLGRNELQWQSWHRHGENPRERDLVASLWKRPEFAPFRRFAVLPSLSRIDRHDPGICVWFTDLRYDLPVLPDTFRYGFCRDDPDGAWHLYRLRYFTEDRRQRL